MDKRVEQQLDTNLGGLTVTGPCLGPEAAFQNLSLEALTVRLWHPMAPRHLVPPQKKLVLRNMQSSAPYFYVLGICMNSTLKANGKESFPVLCSFKYFNSTTIIKTSEQIIPLCFFAYLRNLCCIVLTPNMNITIGFRKKEQRMIFFPPTAGEVENC